ncbi:hypothetical protein SAMN05444405_10417 [Bacteroides luti]|uniref:LTXXQ motif family protein n=1 Tax=Bacteroides luti TaxID=1297750 RepID=A0A1M4XED2_9BACE|nr:hypothetical protein [Bacteroides luti]SHE91957.1 hypothetical protein SAMN05444405_10417 [Bacteroides luti]
MKRLFLVLMVSFIGIIGAFAQDGHRSKMSPEEFRQKQEAFITDKAELTQDEAVKFFPIYFELQDKKRALNDRAWSQIRKGKKEKMTEAEYEAIITNVLNARIASDKLEKAYFYRFKGILSCEKIFKVQGAEMRFHRELIKDFGRKP